MDRTTNILVVLIVMIAPWALAQKTGSGPQIPEDALTPRQLIAWSSLQKPQPAPQPLPPRDTPVPQPDQPADQQATSPADPHGEQTPIQSFTGKIVKDAGRYALKVGTKLYQLEDQDGLARFENQTVKIVGRLDPNETIRVLKIDLLS